MKSYKTSAAFKLGFVLKLWWYWRKYPHLRFGQWLDAVTSIRLGEVRPRMATIWDEDLLESAKRFDN